MSIVQLSNEIDKLAKIINQKNNELDSLKKQYDQKLTIINSYLDKFQIESHRDKLTDDQFIDIIQTRCPSCGTTLNNDDYILIPKSQLDTDYNEEAHLANTGQSINIANTQSSRSQPKKNKPNVTCSKCKRQGHTRKYCDL